MFKVVDKTIGYAAGAGVLLFLLKYKNEIGDIWNWLKPATIDDNVSEKRIDKRDIVDYQYNTDQYSAGSVTDPKNIINYGMELVNKSLDWHIGMWSGLPQFAIPKYVIQTYGYDVFLKSKSSSAPAPVPVSTPVPVPISAPAPAPYKPILEPQKNAFDYYVYDPGANIIERSLRGSSRSSSRYDKSRKGNTSDNVRSYKDKVTATDIFRRNR